MFCTIEDALADFAAGRFLILADDRERENEGDLIVAAQLITAEKVNTMLREARGMLHLATTRAHLEKLDIPLIQARHADHVTPRFGLPFDARRGVSTGISASDRATTILRALDPDATPEDFVVPGHVLPLAARTQGLRVRQGHTEGSVELARLAGLFPAAVMSEVLRPDGEMARGADLARFASCLGCRIIDVASVSAAAEAAAGA
jgi:3,4-dihydroxy-2-butanone 4-phosphate synthase